MKKLVPFFLALMMLNVGYAFESGSYSGESEDIKCVAEVEQLNDRVLFEYHCQKASGLILETAGKQAYLFGSYAKEEEDDSGRYLVRGYGSEKVIEYTITKINELQSTWTERVINLEEGKIHFKMALDNDSWINLVLEKKQKIKIY